MSDDEQADHVRGVCILFFPNFLSYSQKHRGQTLSIAFYPKKGLICFGSEQAAVKVWHLVLDNTIYSLIMC